MLVAYTQAELCILKFIELNVQIRPVFADSVIIILMTRLVTTRTDVRMQPRSILIV